MGINSCLMAGGVICALALLPGISNAQVVRPVSESGQYARSSTREANRLMNQMQYEARRVQYHTQVLDNFVYHTQFAWNTTGIELRRIKSEVNDMSSRLRKLERIENGVPVAEQQAIQNVTPLVQEMANNTDAAINFRNTHHNGFWAPAFMSSTQNLHTEAGAVVHQLHSIEQAAG